MFVLHARMVILLLVAGWLVTVVTSVDPNCPAKPPCLCAGNVITCEAHRLVSVPHFSRILPITMTTLKLGTNHISSIPAGAFSNLNVTHIYLDFNNISAIDETAFAGLDFTLKTVSLKNNMLLSLPLALSRLAALTWLDVSVNPIPGPSATSADGGFTSSILREIGDTITYFRFGDIMALTSWPDSLSHLQRLKELHMDGSVMQHMPEPAFRGFGLTLEKLTIEHSQLSSVPLAIFHLEILKELHIDSIGGSFKDSSVVYPPFIRIKDTLEVLSLNNDHLTQFPSVVELLVHLKNLSLDRNSITYVSDESIQKIDQAGIQTLSLKECKLKRIPGAISDLRHVINLDLSNNNIRTLESNDLQNMISLRTLSLASNPIKYISRGAFFRMNSLHYLDLSNTALTFLSPAFVNLRGLRGLNLQGCHIDCTCDLFWFKRWLDLSGTNITIYGQCETIITSIQTYIDQRLPTCPQYIGR